MNRTTTDSYVITLRLIVTEHNKKHLEKCFFAVSRIYNTLVKHAKKQIKRLEMDPLYKDASGSERTALIEKYLLTNYDFEKYAKVVGAKYSKCLGSLIVQNIAKRVWQAVESYLYKGGKEIHFRKLEDIDSFSNKNNNSKLRFIDGKVLLNNTYFDVDMKFPKNSYYPYALTHDRVKFVRIKRKSFNNGYHYYAELVMEGNSPLIFETKEAVGGLDLGTSTVAFVSQEEVTLDVLAKGVERYNKLIVKYQRKMDASKRATNPDNYNSDGTIKKDSKNFKKKWKYSKNYYKYKWLLKNAYRQKSAYIKQCHNIMAKEMVKNCNVIYTEEMNFRALAKRAKKSGKQDKLSMVTDKNGNTKEIRKNKRRKRFGSSINNRAPGGFLKTLEIKLKNVGGKLVKVNTKEFKASQYNHVTDEYVKKELYERSQIIDGIWIQRDLYSAFLLMNSNKKGTKAVKNRCKKNFNKFVENHNKCIEEIKNNKEKRPSSFGF